MYSRRHTHTILAILCLLLSMSASGRTWIVDASGGGDFTRIGDAIVAAVSGDTVGIRPGEYSEFEGIDDVVGIDRKSLDILGLGVGPEDVRVRLSIGIGYSDRLIIRGMTFHDVIWPISGGALSTVVIQDCIFADNSAYFNGGMGGALYLGSYDALTVEDCVFVRNRAVGDDGNGGAASLVGRSTVFRRCKFEQNETPARGGAIFSYGVEITVENCLFVRNRAYNGAALTILDGPSIVGCTFYENETTWSEGAAIELEWETSAPIERCIVARTINGYGMGCWGSAGTKCFDFWENERGAVVGWCARYSEFGNFEVDPRFCDPANGNFRLMDDSPCLPREHGGYECGLIGALGADCTPEPTIETTWGRIKQRFQTPR